VPEDAVIPGIDTTKPSIARAYDYLLGGKDHFAADRAMADQILQLYPQTAQMCQDNRALITRAAAWAAGRGVAQFLDLGAGLPTSPSVHEAARGVNADARVCYVDNDPSAVIHIQALVATEPGIAAAGHDLADPAAVLSYPAVATAIDPAEPVCVILASVLHFYDFARARDIVQGYVSRMAAGSVLVISCMRNEDPALFDEANENYTAAGVHNFSREELASFFGGLELVPPGIADATAWQPDAPAAPSRVPGTAYVLCGVGLKG
jgi:hypothetical protein